MPFSGRAMPRAFHLQMKEDRGQRKKMRS